MEKFTKLLYKRAKKFGSLNMATLTKRQQHILDILKRNKYENDYAGIYPYEKEEYAKMIDKEVIKPLEDSLKNIGNLNDKIV